MATVKVKFGGRLLKLRPSSLTTSNLAMIFKLDINKGIFLNSEEEGEIILPTAENNGLFEVEDLEKTYLVNGDIANPDTLQPITTATSPLYHGPNPSQSLQIGLPLSYQPVTARTSLNPPPCGSSQTLQRPRFTKSPTSIPGKSFAGWKKSFTVIEVNRMGDVSEKFQIHLTLNERNANVNAIEDLIKGQLGYGIKLLDAKYLPVMPSESTTGSQFWRSNRKIMVVKAEEAANVRKRSSCKRKKPSDVLEQLRRLVSNDDADFEDHDPFSQVPASISHPTTPNPSVEEQARGMLIKIFNCSICLNPAKLPAAACSYCFSVIGCVSCIEQWYESSNVNHAKCPLCRTNRQYNIVPMVREFAALLQQPIPDEPGQINVHSDNDSLETIPYGVNEVIRDVDSDEELPVGLVE